MKDCNIICSIIVAILSISYPVILEMISKFDNYRSNKISKLLDNDFCLLVFRIILSFAVIIMILNLYLVKVLKFFFDISKNELIISHILKGELLFITVALLTLFLLLMRRLMKYFSSDKLSKLVIKNYLKVKGKTLLKKKKNKNQKIYKKLEKRISEKKDAIIGVFDILEYAIIRDDYDLIKNNVDTLKEILNDEQANDKQDNDLYLFDNIFRIFRIVIENKSDNVIINHFLNRYNWFELNINSMTIRFFILQLFIFLYEKKQYQRIVEIYKHIIYRYGKNKNTYYLSLLIGGMIIQTNKNHIYFLVNDVLTIEKLIPDNITLLLGKLNSFKRYKFYDEKWYINLDSINIDKHIYYITMFSFALYVIIYNKQENNKNKISLQLHDKPTTLKEMRIYRDIFQQYINDFDNIIDVVRSKELSKILNNDIDLILTKKKQALKKHLTNQLSIINRLYYQQLDDYLHAFRSSVCNKSIKLIICNNQNKKNIFVCSLSKNCNNDKKYYFFTTIFRDVVLYSDDNYNYIITKENLEKIQKNNDCEKFLAYLYDKYIYPIHKKNILEIKFFIRDFDDELAKKMTDELSQVKENLTSHHDNDKEFLLLTIQKDIPK